MDVSEVRKEHPAPPRQDLARITLALLFIIGLIGASLWILSPFLPALIWATTLVVATWPLMRRAEARLWNNRALAVIFMTLVILIVFVVPFWLAVNTLILHSEQIIHWTEALAEADLSRAPVWLADLPFVGDRAAQAWQQLVGSGAHKLLEQARPYAGIVTRWFLSAIGSFGLVFLQFLLTVAIAAILYAKGEAATASVKAFGIRLAGERGEQSIILAGQAIRAVALGVVVTALVQSAMAGLGLIVAGVPFAPILSAITFMLCIAQIGPALVLIPAVIWMFIYADPGWAIFLLLCSLVAIPIDNFIRPILIRRGADLPLLLILAGVIGGLIAFGLIGIFMGPTILGVAYTLLGAWIAEGDPYRPETHHPGST